MFQQFKNNSERKESGLCNGAKLLSLGIVVWNTGYIYRVAKPGLILPWKVQAHEKESVAINSHSSFSSKSKHA